MTMENTTENVQKKLNDVLEIQWLLGKLTFLDGLL